VPGASFATTVANLLRLFAVGGCFVSVDPKRSLRRPDAFERSDDVGIRVGFLGQFDDVQHAGRRFGGVGDGGACGCEV